MHVKHLVLGGALAATLGLSAVATGVMAQQNEIYVPLLTYRTGPFAGSGIPIATACTII